MIQILWFFIQVYWIPILTVIMLILAVVTVWYGIRDAKELQQRSINSFTAEDRIYEKELHQLPDEYDVRTAFDLNEDLQPGEKKIKH
jgi:hypothetical protein